MPAPSNDAAGPPLTAVAEPQMPRRVAREPAPAEIEVAPGLMRAYVLLALQDTPSTLDELHGNLRLLGAEFGRADVDAVVAGLQRDQLTTTLDEGRVHILRPAGERELAELAQEMRASADILGVFLARCGEQLLIEDPAG